MNLNVFDDSATAGWKAARVGSDRLRQVIARKGEARIFLATGASQFHMLQALTAEPDIDWSRVTVFHLDEYVGLPADHPASFRRYLQERFLGLVPAVRAFHAVHGDAADLERECRRLGALLAEAPIDVGFMGIGENGHVAFNDPPADFETRDLYAVVELDEACRRQQMGEGWFATVDDVPTRAISMTVRGILSAAALIVTVPDERKATAVKCAVEGPVTSNCPASILQTHRECMLFLDLQSAKLLESDWNRT